MKPQTQPEIEALAAEIYGNDNDADRVLIWAQAVQKATALMPWLESFVTNWDVGVDFESSDVQCLAREIASDTGLSAQMASVAAESLQMELAYWAEEWDEQCEREHRAVWAASEIPF